MNTLFSDLNTSSLILGTDLDDTLFTSERRYHSERNGHTSETIVENILQTPQHQIIWQNTHQLCQQHNTKAIIVTARDVKDTQKVIQHFPDLFHHYSITNFGAIVLKNGEVYSAYHEYINETHQNEEKHEKLHQMLLESKPTTGNINVELFKDHDVSCYFKIKTENVPQFVIDAWIEKNIKAYENEINLIHVRKGYVIILFAHNSKEFAFKHLLKQAKANNPQCTSMGLGNTINDWGFMSLCDVQQIVNVFNNQLTKQINEDLSLFF